MRNNIVRRPVGRPKKNSIFPDQIRNASIKSLAMAALISQFSGLLAGGIGRTIYEKPLLMYLGSSKDSYKINGVKLHRWFIVEGDIFILHHIDIKYLLEIASVQNNYY